MRGSSGRLRGRAPREQVLLFAVLAFLFVAFVILVVLLIGSERNRNTLLAEYEADRAASALFETYRESVFEGAISGQTGGASARENLPSNVTGFGVYTGDGESLKTIGDAPQSITALIPIVDPRLFRFDQRTGTIELVRVLGAMPGERGRPPRYRGQPPGRTLFGMMGPGGMHFGPQAPRPTALPAYVLVRLSMSAFFANRNLLTLALILVPIVFGVAMLFVWLLFTKNRRYREKIESQEHLVHLGEIARTLSHEIKNPLSSIRLQTGIMRRVLKEESPQELTLIEEETDRLTHLVERIGEFLRDPAGTPEPIDVGAFLSGLISRFDWDIERLELPEGPLYIHFDRDRLRTVLENILKNAAESGAEKTSFSVSVQSSRQRVEILVADRGSGIPPEIREKIFDPFYTTKVRGSGIGLAISKRFVESLQGTLQLQSSKDGGTEARITLPRIFPEPGDAGGE